MTSYNASTLSMQSIQYYLFAGLLLFASTTSLGMTGTPPSTPPSYESIWIDYNTMSLNPAQFHIDSSELQLAISEHVMRTKEDPQRNSLGQLLDNTLAAFSKKQLTGTEERNFLILLNGSQFFQNFIKHSPAVKMYRAGSLTADQACGLWKILQSAEVPAEILTQERENLKSKLVDSHQVGIFESYFYAPTQTEAHYPVLPPRKTEPQPLQSDLGTLSIRESSNDQNDQEVMDQILKSLKNRTSMSIESLLQLLDRMPQRQIYPKSEKGLLKMRDLLREFSGNNRWTAFDLYHMHVSLNVALVIHALSITETVHDLGVTSRIHNHVVTTLLSSEIFDIDLNPDKPHMRPPKERGIFKSIISDYVSKQLLRISG